jgi:hypothetical protein
MVLRGSDYDIDILLGQIHVSGPKEWKAVNKASVIFDLMTKYSDPIESVAELGMTRSSVDKYYKAFQATELYGKRHPEDKNYVPKFSYFVELYQSKPLTSLKKATFEEFLSAKNDPTKQEVITEIIAVASSIQNNIDKLRETKEMDGESLLDLTIRGRVSTNSNREEIRI